MALSKEYLEYADKMFAPNETRHQEILKAIEFQNQLNEYVFMFMTVVVVGLLYLLIWIAVDNWTRFEVEDDFERIIPPTIDWDKVDEDS